MAPKTSVAQRCSARSATLGTPKGCFAVFPGPLFHQYPAFFDAHDEAQVKYQMLRAHHIEGESVTAVAPVRLQSPDLLCDRHRFSGARWRGLAPAKSGPKGPIKVTADSPDSLLGVRCAGPARAATPRRLAGPVRLPPRPHGDVCGPGPLCRHQLLAGQLDSDGRHPGAQEKPTAIISTRSRSKPFGSIPCTGSIVPS